MRTLIAIAKTVLAWSVFVGLFWLVLLLARTIRRKALGWVGDYLARKNVRGVLIVLWTQIVRTAVAIVNLSLLAFILVQLSLILSYTFSLFPATAGISTTLLGAITHSLSLAWDAVLGYIPNLAMIVVVVFITYNLSRMLRVFFAAVEHGDIHFQGFYPEWAVPTFELVRFLLVVLALIVCFPFLPGSQTGALQGVSIFFGFLLTFGSSSAVSNVVAGVFITYMRPFKMGDRVQIGDAFGDVIEKNLLITRIRTIKNVEVTVPNATVLSAQIQNLSAQARTNRLILNTSVTIGYDAPWRQVHGLMISAALATKDILANPAPFVLQTSLNDFNVAYEINAYTDQANLSHIIYSELHQNIQEKFNEAGVEIMSPNYFALRDGNTVTIPEPQRPGGYDPPSFRVKKTG